MEMIWKEVVLAYLRYYPEFTSRNLENDERPQ
jgi:hypothetical protein